jgi:phosphoglycolate phosphatase-like HAD superfamily hydrolase
MLDKKICLLDIDGTLLDTNDILKAAFLDVVNFLKSKGIEQSVLLQIEDVFFNRFVPYLEINKMLVGKINENIREEAMKIYYTAAERYENLIKPFDVTPLVEYLKTNRYNVGILTMGNLKAQQKKLEYLYATTLGFKDLINPNLIFIIDIAESKKSKSDIIKQVLENEKPKILLHICDRVSDVQETLDGLIKANVQDVKIKIIRMTMSRYGKEKINEKLLEEIRSINGISLYECNNFEEAKGYLNKE